MTEDKIQSLRALDDAGNREDGWTFDELVAIADSLGPLLDEVEGLRAELKTERHGSNILCEQHAAERIEWRIKLAKARTALKEIDEYKPTFQGEFPYVDIAVQCKRIARQALKDTEP